MHTLQHHCYPCNIYYRMLTSEHLYLSYEAIYISEIHVPIMGKRSFTDRAGKFLVPFLIQYIR
jgi:hypothetical protein